jgi:hypothetical protein
MPHQSGLQRLWGSGFGEAATQHITSPEDDPSIVHHDQDPHFSVLPDKHFMQLAKLFEFAERLFIRQLKNYIS